MNDSQGNRFLELLDLQHITEANAEKVTAILSSECNFVKTWSTMPNDAPFLKVVLTRKAQKILIEDHCRHIEEQNLANATFCWLDEIWSKLMEGNGGKRSKIFLNKKCSGPDNLFVYEGPPMQFTRNMQDKQVTQGQLWVIKSIPNNDFDGIKVLVAPACVRELPSLKIDETRDYTAEVRTLVTVRKSEGLPHIFSEKFTVRRIHDHLLSFYASTINKCIDDDVPFFATQIASTDPSEKKMFKLWERNQLLVLISRVKKTQKLDFHWT